MDLEPMDETYLPFSEGQLRSHFAEVPAAVGADEDRHLSYYKAQIKRSRDETLSKPVRMQIQKDERFWTVSALMALFHTGDPTANFSDLLALSDARVPGHHASWSEALVGELKLFFEVGLPSPSSYRKWLKSNLASRTIIPHLIETGGGVGLRLEGATQVDAVLFSTKTAVSVHFEAKVLSDCSATVTYDPLRNQLVRNVDVMLEPNARPKELTGRDPSLASFVLLTPQLFEEHWHSRLYGHLFDRYTTVPGSLAQDLPHRDVGDLEDVAARIGWVTFEDCRNIQPKACPWLAPTA